MVDAGVTDVDRADTVGQHADTVALETAQDGARGAGAERGRGYAGLAGERFTDRRAQFAGQLLARQDGGALQHVTLALRYGGGHDDVLALRRGFGGAGLGKGGAGDQAGAGEQEGAHGYSA